METECSQETVLCFLTERGGRVKNTDLINHFRSFICTEPGKKAAAKEAFKSYVDRVAVVKVENGEKFVCLRKRFRGSVKRKDDHDGPDSAAVVDTSLSAVKPKECQSHAPSTKENKDAEQEIPLGSVCAGARTPPNSTDKAASASDAYKSKDNTVMGNQHNRGNHNRSVGILDKTRDARTTGECVPEIAVNDESLYLPTQIEATNDVSHPDRSERTAETGRGSPRLIPGSCDGGTDEGRSDTPKGSRKSFIAHMINSSPQVRRSMVLKQSRHACNASNDGDSSSVNSAHGEEERAAVTLDPLEHEWMMSACDGDWGSLRRLLDKEPGLVSKKDFVTGFTCMHWAAKLGKHELFAQIVNFARQRGIALDVNARSSAGYTPLHLAAMHNHIEVIKLLVGACDADVDVRDYSGKKASQYLRGDVARDVLDIAGAEAACDPGSEELALVDEAARWKLPRVLQANLRLLHRSASEDDDYVGGLARDMPLRHFNKLKPRLSKVRAGITPIVHSTSHFERLEGATGQISGSVITRPKSNLFG
ncbi:Ankyrin repeat domain-containing protein SOWAHC [Bagarius yarrelli]|uniref:Ankyrin repeat domain-containing protein SOWAHC n=1 Tax=Bagarius yarrelli TaxID=175774 RepID=A0A556TTJ5_BAGYA|nr:Ankyrin repeat domain-containing protein SOWAHC [Bagarius yarrelli]